MVAIIESYNVIAHSHYVDLSSWHDPLPMGIKFASQSLTQMSEIIISLEQSLSTSAL